MDKTFLRILILRRVFCILLFGFSSGFPLSIVLSTSQAWFASENVSVNTIGLLSLVGIPYTWKFVWSPLIDRFQLPFLSRRRAWIASMQCLLTAGLCACAFLSPKDSAYTIAFILLFFAFASASQDIAINAYQTEILKPEERGIGAALYVSGYRVAMLLSGGVAIAMAGVIGWQKVFLLLAGLMLVNVIFTLIAPESTQTSPPKTLTDAVIKPFLDFFKRQDALLILVFIIIFKLGDNFAQALLSTFFIKHLGFSLVQVGYAYKVVGFVATMCGVYVGGYVVMHFGQFRSLFIAAIIQMLSTLTFVWLAMVGKNTSVMMVAVFAEAFTAGIGTSAFIAFIMSLCNKHYTATQFAIFTSLDSIARTVVGPMAASIVVSFGWKALFLFATAMALPGITVLLYLRKSHCFLPRSV